MPALKCQARGVSEEDVEPAMAKMLQQAFTNTVGTNEKIESLNKDREGFSKQRENTRPKHSDISELTNTASERI